MYRKKGYPNNGELVICKPKKIMAHSASMELVEYEKAYAFLHISQVARGWVKSISNHVKKDEEIVCRIMRVGKDIEVSLKQVSKDAANSKMTEWRSEKKAVNIMRAVAKKIGKTEREMEKEVINPVMAEYGSINAFIQLLKQEGDTILEELKIPLTWKEPVLEYTSEELKQVSVRKEIELSTTQPGGVEIIKNLLKKVEKQGVSVKYISAPKYLLRITAKNYKDAQKQMETVLSELENACSKKQVKIEYSTK